MERAENRENGHFSGKSSRTRSRLGLRDGSREASGFLRLVRREAEIARETGLRGRSR